MNSLNDFLNLDSTVTRVIVSSNCGNDASLVLMDMSRFIYLKELIIGDNCFSSVGEFVLNNSTILEKIVIGSNSFTKKKNSFGYDPNRHFYLKNCNNIKELRIGQYSFSDYSEFAISNNPSIEVIEMGDLNIQHDSFNFYYASLELKSLPKLKSVLFGKESFRECNRVVFESD